MDKAVTSIHDLPHAQYRSRDPLKNLKVRVTLKRASKLGGLLPTSQGDTSPAGRAPGGAESQTSAAAATATDQVIPATRQPAIAVDDNDDYTFSWQEKLFSRREEDAYSDRSRCTLPTHIQYHNLLCEIRQRHDGKRPTHHLFTFVDEDSFADTEELQRQATLSADEKPSYLTERLMTVRRRHLEGHFDSSRPSRDSCGRIQPVATWKTDTRLAVAHTAPTRCQQMYIMADLTPDHLEPTFLDEYVLCALKVDANGVLSVKPDFTSAMPGQSQLLPTQRSNRYLLETRHQDLFEFSVEHVSQDASREVEQRETDLVKEVHRRRVDLLSATVGDDFTEPPSADSARIMVLGEIVSAEGFCVSTLYVRYVIELPEGWSVTDPSCLSGTTQLGSTSFWDKSGVVAFALPLEIEFMYCDLARPIDKLIEWPVMYFEVCTVDGWQRQFVEGYTSMRIPSSSGMHELQLLSWRPINYRTKSQMQEFFLGGTPQLEDLTYLTAPKSAKESGLISRFGFQTETTGRLNIRMSCIHQSYLIKERHKQQRIEKLAGDSRSSATATSSSVLGILEAFQRARKKMQNARKGL